VTLTASARIPRLLGIMRRPARRSVAAIAAGRALSMLGSYSAGCRAKRRPRRRDQRAGRRSEEFGRVGRVGLPSEALQPRRAYGSTVTPDRRDPPTCGVAGTVVVGGVRRRQAGSAVHEVPRTRGVPCATMRLVYPDHLARARSARSPELAVSSPDGRRGSKVQRLLFGLRRGRRKRSQRDEPPVREPMFGLDLGAVAALLLSW